MRELVVGDHLDVEEVVLKFLTKLVKKGGRKMDVCVFKKVIVCGLSCAGQSQWKGGGVNCQWKVGLLLVVVK